VSATRAPRAPRAPRAARTPRAGTEAVPAASRRRALAIEGELTIHTAADRRGALLAAIETEVELELDLSAVTELDTAGLQLLLLVRREVAHLGGRLTVVSASQAVADVLAIAYLQSDLSEMSEMSHPVEVRR
jgi:anti-sigma B factor antagonist